MSNKIAMLIDYFYTYTDKHTYTAYKREPWTFWNLWISLRKPNEELHDAEASNEGVCISS